MQLRITTPWAGDGTPHNPYRPAVADAYPLLGWNDVTGADTPSGTYVIEAECDDATGELLLADPDYPAEIIVLEPDQEG